MAQQHLKGSEGDPDYIFFTLNTSQATFICDNFCETIAEVGKNESVMDGRTDRREV